ncbi:hypothetical protein [Amycolatopsis kentuckyensis]|uniref:hypothetical protein n=1 Tax=Amycolatopsis kentuckyensis TaxID=218823 RepID=UPI003563EA8E
MSREYLDSIRARTASRKQLDTQLTPLLAARGFTRTYHDPTGNIRYTHPASDTILDLCPPFGIYLAFPAQDERANLHLGEIGEAIGDDEARAIAHVTTVLHLADVVRETLGLDLEEAVRDTLGLDDPH